MDLIVPLLVFLSLGVVVLLGSARFVAEDQRRWLFVALFAGYALRLAVASMFVIFPELRLFHEDASGYERVGLLLANGWLGAAPPFAIHKAQNVGFFYLSGALMYVFGTFRVNLSFFNALIGTMTAFMVFQMAIRFFHARVARMSTLLVLFAPSMVLWGSIGVKEVLVIFLVMICLSSCLSLRDRFSIPALAGTVLPVLAIQPLRFYIIYFLGFSVMVAMLMSRGRRLLTGIYKQAFMAAVGVALFTMVGVSGSAQEGAEYFNLERVSDFRRGMAVSADSGFAADADISTPVRAVTFLPIGMANLLLAPFPWQMTSLRPLIAAPETIAWWLLFPSMIRGLRLVIRRRAVACAPLLLFALSLTFAYSLIHGNVGSGFRQRSSIFVFFFIFAALGWYQTKCRKAGVDEALLLKPEPSSREEAIATASSHYAPATGSSLR